MIFGHQLTSQMTSHFRWQITSCSGDQKDNLTTLCFADQSDQLLNGPVGLFGRWSWRFTNEKCTYGRRPSAKAAYPAHDRGPIESRFDSRNGSRLTHQFHFICNCVSIARPLWNGMFKILAISFDGIFLDDRMATRGKCDWMRNDFVNK